MATPLLQAGAQLVSQSRLAWPRLLYIDADHTALPTLLNLSIYSTLFRPKVVLFDDIDLNDEMVEFWKIVRTAYPEHSIDCAEIVPGLRESREDAPGFGLILMS